MERKIEKWKNNRCFHLLQFRETHFEGSSLLKSRAQFTECFVKKLGIEYELQGHKGCVNCLQWNHDGSILASGSDDANVILWNPLQHKQLKVIPTLHVGNIFSVKFLGNEQLIATGAGDGRVIVKYLPGSSQQEDLLIDCSCHTGRVKRLETCPEQPLVFWSAGEDGLVLQYDMRETHECIGQSKALIDLSCYKSEIKCIAINPAKPHYVAIGLNDCYVRMYDRRMIKLTNTVLSSELPKRDKPHPSNTDCVQYYAAGHIAKENSECVNSKFAVTYIAFNSVGSEMLVNVGGEQIYLFDVNHSRHINEVRIPQYANKTPSPCGPCCNPYGEWNILGRKKSAADSSLGTALHSCCPQDWSFDMYPAGDAYQSESCSCFYMTRAYESYKRKWVGDTYGAARDYLNVIQCSPHIKAAYVGLVNCLMDLRWVAEADAWIKHFLSVFPGDENILMVQLHINQLELLRDVQKESAPDPPQESALDQEQIKLRMNSLDFEKRYMGHCNITTDIKESNFLGDDFICAGSDEGFIFVWNKHNMKIVKAMVGDSSIVNCVQPHPSACLIASSGIDTAVKIWSPRPEDGRFYNQVKSLSLITETNQERMCLDPFDSMVASMAFMVPCPFRTSNGGNSSNSTVDAIQALSIHDISPTCQTS